jgi:hypothetical protein
MIYDLYAIAHHHSLNIMCYIHTGPQDDKGPIDGHFATAMKHVSRFCNMGNDVVTPIDIVQAPRGNVGLNNFAADLISINRSKVQKFVEDNEDVITVLRKTKNKTTITNSEYSAIGEGDEITLVPASEQVGTMDIGGEDEGQKY